MSKSLRARVLLFIQLLGTLAILAWVPGNVPKTLALWLLWAITFRRVSVAETILFTAACAFFTFMNAMSLRQGIFAFRDPDLLGMPFYEVFMWGFYLLHTWRMLLGPIAVGKRAQAWLMAIAYALAFGAIADQRLLLLVTAVLLVTGLILFHDVWDFAYTGYMIGLGAAIEYTGVWSGQWFYPEDPTGGVPLWFVTLWGGVGLLLRRLVLPMLPSGPATERTN